jgi:hypothetical protein
MHADLYGVPKSEMKSQIEKIVDVLILLIFDAVMILVGSYAFSLCK